MTVILGTDVWSLLSVSFVVVDLSGLWKEVVIIYCFVGNFSGILLGVSIGGSG